MATINHTFAWNNDADQTIYVNENSVINVSAYTSRVNKLTVNSAAGTGPHNVTVNLPYQVSLLPDQLTIGSGLNLTLNSVGRWAVNAAASNSTHVTFSQATGTGAVNYETPSFIGSNTGADTITVNNGAKVATMTTGNGSDSVTVNGSGKITALTMGTGGNTLTLSGTAEVTTATIAGGTLSLADSSDIGTLNLTGTAATQITFLGTGAEIGLISAAGAMGPLTLSGTGNIGRIDTEAGNDVFTITDTDFRAVHALTAIDTGGGDDSLTFNGQVTIKNDGWSTTAIDTGTGNDTITVSAGARFEATGLTAKSVLMGDGDDTFTAGQGSSVDISDLNMGAGTDTVSLGGTTFTGAITTGLGGDTVTVSTSTVGGAIDLGSGHDTLTITGSTVHKIVAGDGDDTVTIRDSTVVGNIDMGAGIDSLTLGGTTVPVHPDLFEYYLANPSTIVHGDIDLGEGAGLKTMVIEDGVRINGTIFAQKSLVTPVTSHITTGDYIRIADSEYSMSLGHGDDVVTIGKGGFIEGQILLNGGNNTLTVGENTSLSSSNVAIYGGTGNDVVTLNHGVTVKGAIALSAGNNELYVGDNVRFTESGTVYSSADTGEGGADLLDFGSGVTLRGNIYTGWGNDVVSMTRGALGAYDAGKPVVSGGIGGETGYGDMLIIGNFFDTGTLAGLYTYDSTLELWFANGLVQQEFTYNGVIYRYFETIKIVPTCFTPGTLIATAQGLRPIEGICVGDMVPTRDSGLRAVRKILVTQFDAQHLAKHPRHLPGRIAAGALGGGLPERDLTVSPQHRVLVRSRIAERMTGSTEVLVPAVLLVGQPGIERLTVTAVTYLHLVFERHELILSEGAVTEAFYPGPAALDGMDHATRRELTEIFPEIATPAAPRRPLARPELRGTAARNMLELHAKNRHPLVA